MNEAEIKAAIAEGERVNRIIETVLASWLPVKVGDTVYVRSMVPVMDEPVVITPELWARIEARR